MILKLLKYFLFVFIIGNTYAYNTKDSVIESAVKQLNYLHDSNNTTEKKNDNWYIYFLSEDINYLKEVINYTNNNEYENIYLDAGVVTDREYLKKLNDRLIELNKSEQVDVYVAFTGADNSITIPVFPKEKTNLENKINYLDSLLLHGNSTTSERDQLLEAKGDLEEYSTDLKTIIEQIYLSSNLYNASTTPNAIMPFSNLTIRSIYNEKGEVKQKRYWAYSLYLGKTEIRFNYKTYRDIFNEETNEEAFGSSDHLKRVSKQVIALEKYFGRDVPLLEDYVADCSALLKDPKYAPLLESRVLAPTIINNPCILDGMIPMGPFDTSESQWMKDTKLFIVAPLYVALLAPVAAEFFIPAAIEYVGTERAVNAAVAMTTAVMIESVLLHYWKGTEVQKENWSDAVLGVNKVNVLYEGAKGLAQLPLPSELIIDCAYNGAKLDQLISDSENYNFDWHTKDCFFGLAITVASKYGLNQGGTLFKTLKNLVKENPKLFVTGWKRILADVKADQLDSFNELNNVLTQQFADVGISSKNISTLMDFINGKKPISELDDALETMAEQTDNAVEDTLDSTADQVADDIDNVTDDIANENSTNNVNKEVDTSNNGDDGLANSVDDALLEAIRVGKRADGSLANALDNASFLKSGDAVRKANGVNRNNKRLLDIGDTDIPNAVSDYTFSKGGQTFSKLVDESWDDFFKRLKANGFNVFESHHIFPVDLFKRESFRKWYELEGFKHFDVNGTNSLDNLIMLEKKITGNGGVHSRHDAYTSKIGDFFDTRWNNLKTQNPSWNDLKLAEEMNNDVINLSKKLKQSLLDNSVKSNIEISKFWDTIDFNTLLN